MVSKSDSGLRISCSATELCRHTQHETSFLTNSVTPVATPFGNHGAASSRPSPRRKPTLHDELIADYMARRPETERRRFVAAVREIVRRSSMLRAQVKLPGWELEPIGFLPDAYVVDREKRELTLVEAEVTSRISPAKWQNIMRLWWLLDHDEWVVLVHTIDRKGGVFSVNTPEVAVLDRIWHDQHKELYERIAGNPPGIQVRAPGANERIEDAWPDAVQEYVQRRGGFDLNTGLWGDQKKRDRR